MFTTGGPTTGPELAPLLTPTTMIIDKQRLKSYLTEHSMETLGYDVFTYTRKREYVLHRHAAMYVLKQHTPLTLTDIGRVCGNGKNFNHATVLHAVRQVEDQQGRYKDQQDAVNDWTVVVFKFLGSDMNKHAAYFDLIKRVRENLAMSLFEQQIMTEIERVVVEKIVNER